MITEQIKSAHSKKTVSRITRPYVEFEIFYLGEVDDLKRVEVLAKSLSSAIKSAKVDVLRIVDASAKSHGQYQSVRLDDLDRLMGV